MNAFQHFFENWPNCKTFVEIVSTKLAGNKNTFSSVKLHIRQYCKKISKQQVILTSKKRKRGIATYLSSVSQSHELLKIFLYSLVKINVLINVEIYMLIFRVNFINMKYTRLSIFCNSKFEVIFKTAKLHNHFCRIIVQTSF